jgi:hypothetical protein
MKREGFFGLGAQLFWVIPGADTFVLNVIDTGMARGRFG